MSTPASNVIVRAACSRPRSALRRRRSCGESPARARRDGSYTSQRGTSSAITTVAYCRSRSSGPAAAIHAMPPTLLARGIERRCAGSHAPRRATSAVDRSPVLRPAVASCTPAWRTCTSRRRALRVVDRRARCRGSPGCSGGRQFGRMPRHGPRRLRGAGVDWHSAPERLKSKTEHRGTLAPRLPAAAGARACRSPSASGRS